MLCQDKFRETYKREPERITFCPYRVCPIGAHSDHQLGKVTGFAIDKGIHIAYSPKLNGVIELASIQFPKRAQWHLRDVPEEKRGDWADYLRGATKELFQAYPLRVGLSGVIEGSLNNYLSDSTASTDDAQKYIDSLNADEKWISYDKSTNTAKITSIKAFVKHCKNPSDFVVAFDKPKGENPLFGYGDCKGAHFDKILADILTKLNIEYAAEYNADLAKTDSFGNSVEYRVNMYTPLYYLMKSRGGFGKSRVAENWRIRTGIEQMSTSVTTEINLALALEHYDGVKSVDFETVWALDHTEAERTGESTDNFIEWVKACSKA